MLGPIPNPLLSGISPYGDAPNDQYWRKKGKEYYDTIVPEFKDKIALLQKEKAVA